MEEEWKSVDICPDYEVSNYGGVRLVDEAVSPRRPQKLRAWLDKNGRQLVALKIDGKQKRLRVNVLVYQAFIGSLPAKFQINHRDGNLLNCRADNLVLADRYVAEADDMRWCGKAFGYWTVIGRSGKDKYGNAMWLCRCVCSTEKRVLVGDLRRGMSRNCGCKSAELKNLTGENNPAWKGGKASVGSRSWFRGKIQAVNAHCKKHGWPQITSTLEEVTKLWQDADGKCAVCRQVPSGKRLLHMDHDHKTGRVRAFLCNHCNVAIGMANDSSSRLRKLAAYLESFSVIDIREAGQFDVANFRISGGKIRAS